MINVLFIYFIYLFFKINYFYNTLVAAVGKECRPAVGACDIAETCTGNVIIQKKKLSIL